LPSKFEYQLVGQVVAGAIAGGIVSALYGGNFWQGFAQGAYTAAIGFLFNQAMHEADTILVAWEYAREYGTTGEGLSDAMRNIEATVDRVFNEVAGRDAIVTYTTNGQHSPNSAHYSGNAIDVRTRDLTVEQTRQVTNRLQQELGAGYRVIMEADHIHIQTSR